MSNKRKTLKKSWIVISKPEVFSQSFWMMKLINKFMSQGKKFKVEKSILNAFADFKREYFGSQPFLILFRYLIHYRPLLGFSKIRISRQFKQIPVPLSPRRQIIVSFNWFVRALRSLMTGHLEHRFYQELKNIRNNHKTALKRYKETQEFHFHLVTNRVNSRFRWK